MKENVPEIQKLQQGSKCVEKTWLVVMIAFQSGKTGNKTLSQLVLQQCCKTVALISSDCFESFSPLNNVITTGSNGMRFRLAKLEWKSVLRVLPPTFKPVNNLICYKIGLMWVVKRAKSHSTLFAAMLQDKWNVFFFFLSFFFLRFLPYIYHILYSCIWLVDIGPLHMSQVDRLAWFPRIRLTYKSIIC